VNALFALAASLSWGTSNYLAGVQTRRGDLWTVTVVSQSIAALGAAVVLLFAGQPSLDMVHSLGPILGGVAGAIGVVCFYKALAIGPLSLVSPIVATQAVVPVVAGLALGERPGAVAYVGMGLAIGGVVVVSLRGREGTAGLSPVTIVLAVVTAVVWGLMFVGLDVGDADPYWSVFYARIASVLVIVLYVLAARKRIRTGARELPVLSLIGLLLTVANLFFITAVSSDNLSVAAVLGSLSPVVTIAYAQILLHERLSVRQWVGAGSVLAGVVFLSV
jgi:drug/metabolite transporter (DMT)-like permease